jgi:hypothetical protein
MSISLARSTNISFGGAFTYAVEQPICELAHLVETGDLTPQPSTVDKNFWIYSGPSVSGDQMIINLGARRVLKVYDKRNWKVEGVSFLSETVDYELPGSANPGAFHRSFGPFSVRLTFENDPRVGHWALDSSEAAGELSQKGETDFIEKSILNGDADCAPYIQKMTDAIGAALSQSYQQVEQQLASSGTIARGADPFVLVSEKAGKAFYVRPGNFANASFRMLMSYCSSLPTPHIQGWRLMSSQDLLSILVDGRLPDRPDRALWGQYNNAPADFSNPNLFPDYPTADGRVGDATVNLYDLPDRIQGIYFTFLYQQNGGTFGSNPCCSFEPKWTAANLLQRTPSEPYTRDEILDRPEGFQNETRVICVADYHP